MVKKNVNLNEMTLEELEEFYNRMPAPTKEQKQCAWKKMDTGIYNSEGMLVGDKMADEDEY